MKKNKYFLFFLLFMMEITGCSNKNQIKENIAKKDEIITISMSEEISPEIKVDIDQSFEGKDLKKYTIAPEPLPVTQEWVENIVEYLPFENKRVFENKSYGEEFNTRLFSLEDQENQFSAQESGIYVSLDKDFYENCEVYYHGSGVYPFFNDEMELFYDQKDLSFMTYQEAETLSRSLLEQAGFTYNIKRSIGYSLSETALEAYRSSHQERFEQMKEWWEETQAADYIESWEGTGGFYVFYYPLQIGNLQIDEGSVHGMMYAHVVVNRQGIARAYIPYTYKVVGEIETDIVQPDFVLDSLIEMYENTILTGAVHIQDVELIFGETEMEITGKREFDMLQVISPCWKFKVQLEEKGEWVDGTVLYDAVTGKRVG